MSVEVPSYIPEKDREFQKGMFVAKNVKRTESGVALFGEVDAEVVESMQLGRRCQMCDKKIAKSHWCVFPGGPVDYKFSEAPLHVGCARYSMQVCPHILRQRDYMTFVVCKKYVVQKSEPPEWRDPGAFPVYDGISQLDLAVLAMAHGEPVEINGTEMCPDCRQSNMGRMTYDEFMRWSS